MESPFFGIGQADPGTLADFPTDAYWLRASIGAYDISYTSPTGGAYTQVVPDVAAPLLTADTEHRLRVTRTGDTVLWEIDAGYTGTFAADYSESRLLSADAPFLDATNSRLFFGVGAYNDGYSLSTFDDVEMTPEPATLAVLAIGGVMVMALRRRTR